MAFEKLFIEKEISRTKDKIEGLEKQLNFQKAYLAGLEFQINKNEDNKSDNTQTWTLKDIESLAYKNPNSETYE